MEYFFDKVVPGAQRDDKGLEICTAGLEFESGRVPLIRA